MSFFLLLIEFTSLIIVLILSEQVHSKGINIDILVSINILMVILQFLV